MTYPIDLYKKAECFNDLLYLSYIVSGNVDEVVHTSEEIVVVPKTHDNTFYNSILSSYTSFIRFYKELTAEGDFQKEIEFFKKRFDRLSFISAYDLFKKLKECNVEEEENYTLETSKIGIEANNLAISKGLECAAETLGSFYKKYKNKTKYKKLIKEAKNVKFSQ